VFADAAILLVGYEILQGVVMDANIPSISHDNKEKINQKNR